MMWENKKDAYDDGFDDGLWVGFFVGLLIMSQVIWLVVLL